jgi:hypothetical protein
MVSVLVAVLQLRALGEEVGGHDSHVVLRRTVTMATSSSFLAVSMNLL